MPFETHDAITNIIDFLYTCPLIEENGVTLGSMGVTFGALSGYGMGIERYFHATELGQSMIRYDGSHIVDYQMDIYGNAVITRQADFTLFLLRQSNDRAYANDASLFCYNFERWIDYANHCGNTPRLGNVQDYHERWWAENAMVYERVTTPQGEDIASNYQVQLHALYQMQYKAV